MRRPLSLLTLFLLPALLPAADFVPALGDLLEPQKALAKSTTPLSLAGFLLEAGERRAVESFIAGLPERQALLANKLRSHAAFYDGDLPGAFQSLENVEKPDAWTEAQKKFIQDVMAVQFDFTEARSDHFLLRSSKKDAFLSQIALPALERAYEKAAPVFKVSLSTPIRVEVYPDAASFSLAAQLPPDFVERTGLVVLARFRRILLLSPRAAPGGFRWLDELSHAYHRLLLNEVSGGLAPVWLREGICRYYAEAWRRDVPHDPAPCDADMLARAALVNPSTGSLLLPFARMEPSLRALRRREEVALALVESADAVDFLIKSHGQEKLPALLDAFRRFPVGTAFTRSLGMSDVDLENAWIKSLEGRAWVLSKGSLGRGFPLKGEAPPVGPEAAPFAKAADALFAKRQWGPALTQYRKALALEEDNGSLLLRAASAAQALEDFKAAEGFLRRAVEKNGFFAPPFVALGALLYEDGRYDEAQRVLQEGLEIQPFNPLFHEYLGLISMDVGDPAAARQSLQRSLDLNPDNPNLRDTLRKMPKGQR